MDPKRLVAALMRQVPLLYPLLLRILNRVAAPFTVGVVGVAFNQEGKILLVEHVFRSRYSWGLPGGWVRRRERPQDALRRELQEEVGLRVKVGPPVLIELDGPPDHLETAFLCEVEGEVDRLSGEILATRWVSPDPLPDGLRSIDREMIRRARTLRNRLADQSADAPLLDPRMGDGG
ncbi:MAG: NUDIX hydrolase [Anaerolineae bacterium]|jgi:8-oxo-dGTP pyrophosphatase MutT (NUDIX family)